MSDSQPAAISTSTLDAWLEGHSVGMDGEPRMPPDWFTPAAQKEWLRGYDDGVGWNKETGNV